MCLLNSNFYRAYIMMINIFKTFNNGPLPWPTILEVFLGLFILWFSLILKCLRQLN